jgi:hypothetical protein
VPRKVLLGAVVTKLVVPHDRMNVLAMFHVGEAWPLKPSVDAASLYFSALKCLKGWMVDV